MGVPRPPADAGPEGRRLWRSVLAETGLTTVTAFGSVKLNPVAAELRSAELALCRLLLCLRIPVGGIQDEPGETGGQYRGMRGVYALHGGAA